MEHQNDYVRQLYYIGAVNVPDVVFPGNISMEQRSSEERLIDSIEEAQQRGSLPCDPAGCTLVSVHVNWRGLKVSSVSRFEDGWLSWICEI